LRKPQPLDQEKAEAAHHGSFGKRPVGGSFIKPSPPSTRVPAPMHHGNDGDQIWCDAIDNQIGKPPEKCHPSLAMDLREDFGLTTHEREACVQTTQEFGTQTRCLIVVPIKGFPNVFLRRLPNNQGQTHDLRCNEALTRSHKTPSAGDASKSSKRRSSSLRCASVSRKLAESSAIESHRSPTN